MTIEAPTRINLTKEGANAVIDEYLDAISNPRNLPSVFGRTAMEFMLQRHGVIRSVRELRFLESHALWYACLVLTRRVGEVDRAERAYKPKSVKTTARTIRQLLSDKPSILRGTHTALMLKKFLAEAAQ